MKVIPRKTKIVVEQLEQETTITEGGIVLPQTCRTYEAVKIIDVGPEVEDLKAGDIVLVHGLQYEERVGDQWIIDEVTATAKLTE